MKRVISSIIVLTMAASSLALPVSADYTAADYDILNTSLTFNDGTASNGIDNSPAKEIGDSYEIVMKTSIDSTKEFFLSFDFCFNADSGVIEIPKYNSTYSKVDKVGPILTVYNGQLRTQTGKLSYQDLGTFDIGSWYTAEIEGRTGMGQQYTTFRLYDDKHTLVRETTGFNMRNLSSEGRSFNGMNGRNVSIDNIRLVEMKPDTLTITADKFAIDAGQSLSLDYVMTRDGKEYNKYPVEWSLDDASLVSIADGTVTTDISCPTKTVTATASAVFGGKTLIGSKEITINSVNTEDEKFDTISISGANSLKAGSSTVFTAETSKNGIPTEVSEGDIVWSLYDGDNVYEYTHSGVKIENGVLTAADGVLPHAITVRAGSASGKVYGSKRIDIEFSDSQRETVVYLNAFENGLTQDNRAVSADGSTAYTTSSSADIWTGSANEDGYTLTELDIKFTAENSGIILKRRDAGKVNTQIWYVGGNLRTNAGVLMSNAQLDTWYHLEVLYSAEDASCNIYKYDEEGRLGSPLACNGIDRRNASLYGRLTIQPGTVIDNLKISKPLADEVDVTAPSQYIFAGESKQFTASLGRNGLPMSGGSGIVWSVLDSDNLPIIDGSVTIDGTGLLSVDSQASPQTVKVRASSSSGAWAEAEITVQVSEIFAVTGIGRNEDGTKLVRLYADKNFYYSDDVTFIIAVRGESGVLKAVTLVKTFGDRLNLGSNELTINLTLPSDFNPDTDTIETMVWTAL